MKGISGVIIGDAEKLVSACKTLDYSGIVQHNPQQVARLKQVLSDLSIVARRSRESLEDYAGKQAVPSVERGASVQAKSLGQIIESEEAVLARRSSMEEILKKEGFEERIAKVYNSFSSDRITAFPQVSHRRGLPPFDVVLSADYAPVAGLHGIFVTEKELMSIILPSDTQPSGDWQVLKSTTYQGLEEMVEKVTLLAAGFDLP